MSELKPKHDNQLASDTAPKDAPQSREPAKVEGDKLQHAMDAIPDKNKPPKTK
jgi:hypothetical protein